MVDNVIIGANSYIARNFTNRLIKYYSNKSFLLYGKEDCQVDGFDNYEKINILDKNSLDNLDLNCKNIFMFVGKTGSAVGFEKYDEFIDVNQRSLLNLLDRYVKCKSNAKIVFLSTRLIYGDKDGFHIETELPDLKSVYAVNKFACEQYLKIYNNVFGVKYVVLRLCIPYGSIIKGAGSYGTCGFMFKKAVNGEDITLFGNGNQKRTFTHIEDLTDILYNVAYNDNCINDIYNIGGERFSLLEVASFIADKYNVEVKHIDFPIIESKIESGDTVFDSSKLDSVIGNYYKHKFIDWLNNEEKQ